MKKHLIPSGVALVLLAGMAARADIKVTVEHNANDQATPAFKFKSIPSPSTHDAATAARFSIVSGERDDNGASLEALNDGKLPTEEDQPERNFFFDQGTEGGRLLVDLGGIIPISQINTYSWHPDTRAPQIYKLYASDGTAQGFDPKPGVGADPTAHGWKLAASVNTKPKTGDGGGQYGVSISDSEGVLGRYRYLLFEISRTEADDDFGNTFYSEIDVIAREAPSSQQAKASASRNQERGAE